MLFTPQLPRYPVVLAIMPILRSDIPFYPSAAGWLMSRVTPEERNETLILTLSLFSVSLPGIDAMLDAVRLAGTENDSRDHAFGDAESLSYLLVAHRLDEGDDLFTARHCPHSHRSLSLIL